MKKLLIILLIFSITFANYYPSYYAKNITSKTWFGSSEVTQYTNQVIYPDVIIQKQYQLTKFYDCNIRIKILKTTVNNMTVNVSGCGIFTIDKKYTWLCNGYLLKYNYAFKNEVSYSLGYLMETDWIKEGRYNCKNENYFDESQSIKKITKKELLVRIVKTLLGR